MDPPTVRWAGIEPDSSIRTTMLRMATHTTTTTSRLQSRPNFFLISSTIGDLHCNLDSEHTLCTFLCSDHVDDHVAYPYYIRLWVRNGGRAIMVTRNFQHRNCSLWMQRGSSNWTGCMHWPSFMRSKGSEHITVSSCLEQRCVYIFCRVTIVYVWDVYRVAAVCNWLGVYLSRWLKPRKKVLRNCNPDVFTSVSSSLNGVMLNIGK